MIVKPTTLFESTERIKHLESVLRKMLTDVAPHVRDTGHNAADREISEAIKAAKAALDS